jgi:hypothetical protein
MASSIMWVKAVRHYHDLEGFNLVGSCTSISNQLAIDTDCPASGLPASMPIGTYNAAISAVNTDALSRQTSKAIALTEDEKGKEAKLVMYTDVVVHYIESTLNLKYPNNQSAVISGLERFGLSKADHGTGHKHIFKILEAGPGYAVIECPSGGAGCSYNIRWSGDEKTWTIIKSNHKSKFKIINLPGDARAYFQFDISTSTGRGVEPVIDAHGADFHWSAAISEMIPAIKSSGTPLI